MRPSLYEVKFLSLRDPTEFQLFQGSKKIIITRVIYEHQKSIIEIAEVISTPFRTRMQRSSSPQLIVFIIYIICPFGLDGMINRKEDNYIIIIIDI